MGFVPPLNLGGFQPSPATLAQWVYQIWQYLQENPIATQEQLQEYIGTFITTSPETQTMIGEGVEQYLTENPPAAPVQSVQGKTGAVQLAYNEIVPASNAVPVYKASSTPNTNTLVGQYNLGYRLFVNTATQEIFTISPAGALSLVGRGKFDGTTVDLNSTQGDTTIFEAISEHTSSISTLTSNVNDINDDITEINSDISTLNTAVTPITGTPTDVSSSVTDYLLQRIGQLVLLTCRIVDSGTASQTIMNLPDGFKPPLQLYLAAPSNMHNTRSLSITTEGAVVFGQHEANVEYRVTAVYAL